MKKKKEPQTVKQTISHFNTLMVIITLLIFLLIAVFVIKGFSEYIENQWRANMTMPHHGEDIEEWYHHYSRQRDTFILLFAVGGVVCVYLLYKVSQIFTNQLTNRIMEPLNELSNGAERIRNNDLSTSIQYTGEKEFEDVCNTFNDMQTHILDEQEKNRKYEIARTEMIAGISHDLRTPLTATQGAIKGILDGVAATPETEQKFLQTAYRRTIEMDQLLQQLLMISRMETGHVPLNLQDIDLAEFADTYVDHRVPDLRNNETLNVETNNIHSLVSIDPDQFMRIFDNLIKNSEKYAQADPLRMNISISETPNDVIMTFSDNGVGVPADKIDHIFEEFYRADESRHEKEGNGLGLYIVQYLIKAMHGRVWAENNHGLQIHMKLPKKGQA